MIIEQPVITDGALGPRLVARFRIGTELPGLPGELYFESYDGQAEHLSRLSDPFLIGLLPIAMKFGEDITVAGPVSAALAYGLDTYQGVVSQWFPEHCRPVKIHYEQLVSRRDEARPAGVGCSFSGGLDSYYSVWRHLPEQQPVPEFRITHALIVNGFDYMEDYEHRGTARQMYAAYAPIMASWDIELRVIESNLKLIRNIVFAEGGKQATWGSILVANAHALGGLFGRYLVPAGATYSWKDMIPHGSHFINDTLLSTDQLQIIHSGGRASRSQKVEALMDVPQVRQGLRVCFGLPRFDAATNEPVNCCNCEKCVRTIASLDIVGKLPAFPTFRNHLPLSIYKDPQVLSHTEDIFIKDNNHLAIRWQRADWAIPLKAAWDLAKQQNS